MISAITTKKAAAANSAMPMPPDLTLNWISDFASWISLRIRLETSRVASETRRPMVGSLSCTGSFATRRPYNGVRRRTEVRWGRPHPGNVTAGEPGSLVGPSETTVHDADPRSDMADTQNF